MGMTATACARGTFAVLAVAGGLTLPGSTAFGQTDARGFVRVSPEQIKWVDEPDGLGVQRAVAIRIAHTLSSRAVRSLDT